MFYRNHREGGVEDWRAAIGPMKSISLSRKLYPHYSARSSYRFNVTMLANPTNTAMIVGPILLPELFWKGLVELVAVVDGASIKELPPADAEAMTLRVVDGAATAI